MGSPVPLHSCVLILPLFGKQQADAPKKLQNGFNILKNNYNRSQNIPQNP